MVFKTASALALGLIFCACAPEQKIETPTTATDAATTYSKVTPVLLAEDLEACVKFWEAFGFNAVMSMPFEDKLGFVILQSGSAELMYQSFALSNADNPAAIEGVDNSVVYLEVNSLDAIVETAQQFEIVKPDHKTDYGSREIYLKDPAGNLIGFSQQGI